MPPPITFDIHLEDDGVVDETVDRGERHCGIGKNLPPFAKGLICCDQQGAPFVAGADQFEQHAGLGLVLGDIGQIVEDQQVKAVKAVDGGFEPEIAPGDLQLLHQIGVRVNRTR